MAHKTAYERVEIIGNYPIAGEVYELTVACKREVEPGQFFMLRGFSDINMLPRPISINTCTKDTLTFQYATVGKGTRELALKKSGDYLEILGPLGNGFLQEELNLPHLPQRKIKIALVAGGIGIAPFRYLSQKLAAVKSKLPADLQDNLQVDLYAGFRSEVYGITGMEEYVDHIHIATNDGTCGHRGYITEILPADYDYIYACGPTVMLRSLQQQAFKGQLYLSLENRMACGIGACLACSCRTTAGMKRVCKEGPVFAAREVCL